MTDVAAAAAPTPVSIRPSWRVVTVHLVCTLATGGLAALGWWLRLVGGLRNAPLRGTMVIARRANVVVTVFVGQRPNGKFDQRPHGTPAEVGQAVEIARAALAAVTLS